MVLDSVGQEFRWSQQSWLVTTAYGASAAWTSPLLGETYTNGGGLSPLKSLSFTCQAPALGSFKDWAQLDWGPSTCGHGWFGLLTAGQLGSERECPKREHTGILKKPGRSPRNLGNRTVLLWHSSVHVGTSLFTFSAGGCGLHLSVGRVWKELVTILF